MESKIAKTRIGVIGTGPFNHKAYRDLKRYQWPVASPLIYTMLPAKNYVRTLDGVIRRRQPKPYAALPGRQRSKARKAEHRYCAGLVQMAIDNASPGHPIIDAQL